MEGSNSNVARLVYHCQANYFFPCYFKGSVVYCRDEVIALPHPSSAIVPLQRLRARSECNGTERLHPRPRQRTEDEDQVRA